MVKTHRRDFNVEISNEEKQRIHAEIERARKMAPVIDDDSPEYCEEDMKRLIEVVRKNN